MLVQRGTIEVKFNDQGHVSKFKVTAARFTRRKHFWLHMHVTRRDKKQFTGQCKQVFTTSHCRWPLVFSCCTTALLKPPSRSVSYHWQFFADNWNTTYLDNHTLALFS